jgi:hypothetical protein
MSTATRIPTERESAKATRAELPRLDKSQPPRGIEVLGEPFRKLVSERKRLMNEALHARTASERADVEVHQARKRDAEAFEAAALAGEEDPGRVHEAEALRIQDEARRKAIGLTRAHNTVVAQIRAAIDGEDGDSAAIKASKKIDKPLERMRHAIENIQDDAAEIGMWAGLQRAITSTRKADHVTLRSTQPIPPKVTLAGQEVDAMLVLEALREWDPRQDDAA